METTTKTAKIYYLLSEAGRKQSLLQGGDGREEQVIEASTTPQLLELATVGGNGDVTLRIGYVTPRGWGYNSASAVGAECKKNSDGEWVYLEQTVEVRFDIPQTIDQLIAWEKYRQSLLAAAKAEYDSHTSENEAVRTKKEAEHAERKAKMDAEAAERKRQEAGARAAYEADRTTWVEANGSDYLKTALQLGYNVNRTYVEDRAAAEHPGFVVDYRDEYSWRERINPSDAALKYVAALVDSGIDAEVVWLTDVPGDDEFEACEAIVICEYLGRYDLVKIAAED